MHKGKNHPERESFSVDREPQPGRHYEKVPVHIFHNSSAASQAVAEEIASLIRSRQKENRSLVLGLATGSSPLTVYEELVRLHRHEGLSFRNVITFNLDEYYPMDPGAMQSYVRFMRENLFDHIDMDPANIHIPDGTIPYEQIQSYCSGYEASIDECGGIDLQILGIGRTGHIGFNEPGSSIDSMTRLITLDHITVADAAGDFYGEENVPSRAITMGIGSIMKSKRVILLAWGEAKTGIIRRAVEGEMSDLVPASYLQRHGNALFVLDNAAASELTRVKTPWLTGPCEFDNDRIVRKGVVWLCQKTNKPILKLTARDYLDHGMYDLMEQKDAAYTVNIKVFNVLQHTITGWPGGKPDADDSSRPERSVPFPKKVLVFSPHPDDDVISMGGTLIRLVDQGHDVHVAYQTSGNIAVFDDDVVRYLDFVNDFHSAFNIDNRESMEFYEKTVQFIKSKKPAQEDSADVLKIKTLIREGEAKAACRFVGIPENNIHFLNLPFYQTGTIRKNRPGDTDADIVYSLVSGLQPHQIYAAGDLTDPHGTHRFCLQTILKALERCRDEAWMLQCYVWLYRGAWQEWDIEDVDMAVPLSPQELQKKRRAIFKHQSQKDRPLFPGVDSREFWQRAESRNRGTADRYNRLGMAEYEAIEVFKRYHVS